MHSPRFSIVIPTRNRAALLPYALRSALAQTYENFELVVVNNASTDRTAEVLTACGDRRLTVINSTVPRLMHDNWSLALTHARGRHVLFLCDDDAWHPRLLETVDRVIERTGAEIVCWRSMTHFSNDWFESDRRGRVVFGPPFTDRVFEIDAQGLLDAAFDMRVTITDIVPRMLNSAVSAALIDRLDRAGIGLFRPCNPDYSCLIAFGLQARRMVYVDAPLLVSGATPMSIGASASQRGDAARRFLADLLRHEPNLVLPHPPRTPSVWIGQTYLQCAREIPSLHNREVNWTHLYGLAGQDIDRHAAAADVSDWRAELADTLKGPQAARRDAILSFISQRRSIETDAFLKPLDDGPIIGLGPSMWRSAAADEVDGRSIDALALSLDKWMSRHVESLSSLWDVVAARSGPRTPVVVGLGLNGRAVLRMPPATDHSLHGRLRSHDDHSDLRPPPAPRLEAFTSLDPRRHFVLLTPTDNRQLTDRLAARGFRSGADMASLAEAVARPATAGITTVAADIPSGCKSECISRACDPPRIPDALPQTA
jgi:glycosyltransferase involved in cell wall biosynthesis